MSQDDQPPLKLKLTAKGSTPQELIEHATRALNLAREGAHEHKQHSEEGEGFCFHVTPTEDTED